MCLAVPMKLLEISEDGTTGTVDMGGAGVEVGLDLVPEAKTGDFVLVHAGMAIEIMDDAEAKETLEVYRKYADIPGLLIPQVEKADG